MDMEILQVLNTAKRLERAIRIRSTHRRLERSLKEPVVVAAIEALCRATRRLQIFEEAAKRDVPPIVVMEEWKVRDKLRARKRKR